VDNIFDGTKKYEFRKVRCKRDVTRIMIYCTYPVMKIVGEAAVSNILEDTPDELWKKTYAYAGIDREFFDNYFEGRERSVAYELGEVTRYDTMRDLSDLGLNAPPQSFTYID
jgi:predicted transcriptional regulator